MMNASNMDDARARASRALEVLERSIVTRAGAEAMESFHKENLLRKEHVEALLRENTVLKRAVAIQHERQKEYDQMNQELQHLKQLVSQYQEQVKTLEPPEMFRGEIGSHAMDLSMEKLRANLENIDFQGAGDTVRSDSLVTPGSPGQGSRSISRSDSGGTFMPLEPEIQIVLPERSKKRQNSSSAPIYANLIPF